MFIEGFQSTILVLRCQVMNFLKTSNFNFQQYCLQTHGSIKKLFDKAKNGDILAQQDLGLAYYEGGDFLPKDIDKAIYWLSSAVENGYEDPNILGKVGEAQDLKGTPLYQRKAFEMYNRAANLGCTNSQINLAEIYRCGVKGVVNENIEEAFKWYKMAAGENRLSNVGALEQLLAGAMRTVDNTLGSVLKFRALRLLFKYYLKGDCPEGRPQPTKAVYYLTRAAELGDAEAQLEVGQIYLTGGCEQLKDVARARRWLQKASARGDVRAKQLLEECLKQSVDTKHPASEVSKEAFRQTCDILKEKMKQRSEARLHPFAISQPVPLTEELLSDFVWSPTARIYLQALKQVKEGFEVLQKSNFTNERGIALIAHGYLTENSILQAFPADVYIIPILPQLFQLCEKTLEKNPYFFEALVVSFALQAYEKKLSMQGSIGDIKKIMCIDNLIHFIKNTEPDGVPSQEPFNVNKNYSSWLHLLYYFLAAIFTAGGVYADAADAYENSLQYCPAYYESKRGLGYTLLLLYISRLPVSEELRQVVKSREELPKQTMSERKIPKYDSWTTQQLKEMAVKVLNEYVEKAPCCHKPYPHAYYYLAQISLLEQKLAEFRKYYEQGQDAEEKRVPVFESVSLLMKDLMTPVYQLFVNVQKPTGCGNRSCIWKVKETELKSCSRCRMQKYCSKECQKADWKNHKAACKTTCDAVKVFKLKG